jgi:hypothetical protein
LLSAVIEVKYRWKVFVTHEGGTVDEKITFGQTFNADSDSLDAVGLFLEFGRK